MSEGKPTFLSKPAVCKRENISNTTFYKLAKQGKFRLVKIGRSTRVPLADIEAFEARLLEAANG